MLLAFLAVLGGLALLIWSADRFVSGAAAVAKHAGLPPLLIGMLVVGFGTSAPEIVISVLAALDGTPDIALGNAYGSNIANLALILGVTAIITPVVVDSKILKQELPILTAVTAVAAWQLWDGQLTRAEGLVLLVLFAGLMGWTVWQGMTRKDDELGRELESEYQDAPMPLRNALIWLLVGLLLLVASSRLLIWGAVTIAQAFGVSDLVIGLTIVAIGTSLPELASSISAALKGEDDIALGNVVGSNLFNTLIVVGLAVIITPSPVSPEVLSRDLLLIGVLTVSLFAIGYDIRRTGIGRINRFEGILFVSCYVGYVGFLLAGVR